ncbi:MAG: putative selenium-dependent hydroxylase accessory protein YqeC [Clostridia bacterium]|nr:putative selenium-dependent hydroxylase accessory protein YqeC [Clostridia bacterium]
MPVRLSEALALPEKGELSLVGGGGKSTLLVRLAGELAGTGKRVAAVTTTRITRAQGEAAGLLLLNRPAEELRAAFEEHPAVCAASLRGDGKLGPPPAEVLSEAYRLADWVLSESDGAGGYPVKAPADHEPVLLPGGCVAAVAGLSALGRPLDEVCFRPEVAAKVLGVPTGAVLTPRLLARLLTSEGGQFKGVGKAARFRAVLNQADTSPFGGEETAEEILRLLPGCRVAVTALWENDCVKGVYF